MDFIDTEGELKKYSIQEIGVRSVVDNDTSLKTVYQR
jgi:hypothetical protein